ncbi:MAG: methanogenesis marker protein Mmp4/MtxX [Methanomassiliicoccales archaeon]
MKKVLNDLGMLTPELLFSKAKNPGLRIGVGAMPEDSKVCQSIEQANAEGYGKSIIYHDPSNLIKDLYLGKLDAAVRGSLDSNSAMGALKKTFDLNEVQRMAFLQPRSGRMFLLAPVGVDEGWSRTQKIELAERGCVILRRLGVEPKVGILSGGRKSDRGRHEVVDRTLEDAVEIVSKLKEKGIQAEDYEILIENAAKDCDVLIAPDGISGNLIFRTLHFLGEGKALGAVVLNIDKIFVDTSRAKSSYIDSIALASALAVMV